MPYPEAKSPYAKDKFKYDEGSEPIFYLSQRDTNNHSVQINCFILLLSVKRNPFYEYMCFHPIYLYSLVHL